MIVTMDEVAELLEASRDKGHGGRCLYIFKGAVRVAWVEMDGTVHAPHGADAVCIWAANRAWDGLTGGQWAALHARLAARGHTLKLTEGRYHGSS